MASAVKTFALASAANAAISTVLSAAADEVGGRDSAAVVGFVGAGAGIAAQLLILRRANMLTLGSVATTIVIGYFASRIPIARLVNGQELNGADGISAREVAATIAQSAAAGAAAGYVWSKL